MGMIATAILEIKSSEDGCKKIVYLNFYHKYIKCFSFGRCGDVIVFLEIVFYFE